MTQSASSSKSSSRPTASKSIAETSKSSDRSNPKTKSQNNHSHGHVHDHDHGHDHSHSHSEESRRKLINRLSRIEGHVRGVKTMITEDRACPEVLIQLAAIRGAIDRVSRAILDDHMSECLTRAAHEGNIESEIDELKQALDRFLPG
ncbi:MAG: metal-sensing transcriptional repressor [Cyanobacteria bacterium P01_D01_bin.73]